MARPIGYAKTGGRQRGTPNLRTTALNEVFEAAQFSVPERLLELLPSLAPEKQADVLLGLMRYIYPAKKAVEHTIPQQPIENYQDLNSNQIKDMIKETLEILKPGISKNLR